MTEKLAVCQRELLVESVFSGRRQNKSTWVDDVKKFDTNGDGKLTREEFVGSESKGQDK